MYASSSAAGWYVSTAANSRNTGSGALEGLEISLREAYVDWYLTKTDVRVGRQVLAWGTVEANNVVDNLNAVDRTLAAGSADPADLKHPVAALRAVSYWGASGDVRAELVLLPEFRGDTLPEDLSPSVSVKNPDVGLSHRNRRIPPDPGCWRGRGPV